MRICDECAYNFLAFASLICFSQPPQGKSIVLFDLHEALAKPLTASLSFLNARWAVQLLPSRPSLFFKAKFAL